MFSIFVGILAWVVRIKFCLCDVQKFASLTPQKESSNDAQITRDSEVSISGNYWDIGLQSNIQSSYDLKLNLNNEWSFKSNKESSIKITIDGLPLIDISNDMTLFFVFTVNDLQYISLSIHLDSNGNKYTFYSSLSTFSQNQATSEWISNINQYDMRYKRISNGNQWIEFEPEYTFRALWPISFEFINDAINNKIIYKFYSRNIPVLIKQFTSSSFTTNTPINAYIMIDEPKENLYITSIDVSLSYDSQYIIPPSYANVFTTLNPTLKPTANPISKPTTNPTNLIATNISTKISIENTNVSSINNSIKNDTNIFIPSELPSLSPSINPILISTIKTTEIDHSLTFIVIAISSSVTSFLCGIIIGLIFCKRNKIYHKPKKHKHRGKHRHKPIPKDIESDNELDEKSESLSKSLQRLSSHSPYHHVARINSDIDNGGIINPTPDGGGICTTTMIKINSIDAQSDIYYNTNNYNYNNNQNRHNNNNSNAQSILFINNSSDDSDEYEDMYNNNQIKQECVTPKTPMNNNNNNINNDIDNALQYAAKSRISQEINYLKEFDEENENENKMENEINNNNDTVNDNDNDNENEISECNDEIIMNDEIKNWLTHEVELPQYLDNFGSYGYESLKFIREISNKSELSEIGINIKGHQTKIMAEITKLAMIDQLEGRSRR